MPNKQNQIRVARWVIVATGIVVAFVLSSATTAQLVLPTQRVTYNQIAPVKTLTQQQPVLYAPAGLTGCNEMMWYRIDAGLPPVFDRIGYRESRCRNENTVRTSCCYGYWQLAIALHLKTPATRNAYHQCGVDSVDDINSDTPQNKKAQACATKVLYQRNGLGPWK